MKKNPASLNQLLRTAAQKSIVPLSPPWGLEERILANWRSEKAAKTSIFESTFFLRPAFLCALAAVVLALSINYELIPSVTDPEARVADSALFSAITP